VFRARLLIDIGAPREAHGVLARVTLCGAHELLVEVLAGPEQVILDLPLRKWLGDLNRVEIAISFAIGLYLFV
jgi:hypothetical protein